MKKYSSFIILLLLFFYRDICHTQTLNLAELNRLLQEKDYVRSLSLLKKFDNNELTEYEKGLKLLITAECYYRLEIRDIAYEKAIEAKWKFRKLDSINKIIDSNQLMQKILGSQNNDIDNSKRKELIDENNKLLSVKKNYWAGYAENHRAKASLLLIQNTPSILGAIREFRKAIHYATIDEDSIMIAYCFQNISLCSEFLGNRPDSVLHYAHMAENLFVKFKENTVLSHGYNNRALTYRDLGNYRKALMFLDKADSLNIRKNYISTKALIYDNYSALYDSIKDYRKSLVYLRKSNQLKDSLKELQQGIRIKESEEKFQNEKLRADNFKMSSQIIGLVLLILLLSGFTYQFKRKQILAKKEKELATQKNLTLLKEQEILSINSMIAGQEKERKRVAEDLHDNLGSVIATLKLHFDNLRLNRERKKVDQEVLFDKTESLIEETYQKVRNMAHAKNAGVIANQGLLVAVKLMAEKVSSANTLNIQVLDYGLDKPLENSLELAIFRIIQELTTNIIKHAQASQATINLSHDEDAITVLIEDNGIGMSESQIDIQKGMGLYSIKTRVEHMDGSFTIDSTPNKGTTIIINIPT